MPALTKYLMETEDFMRLTLIVSCELCRADGHRIYEELGTIGFLVHFDPPDDGFRYGGSRGQHWCSHIKTFVAPPKIRQFSNYHFTFSDIGGRERKE